MRDADRDAAVQRLVNRRPELHPEDVEDLFDHACATLDRLYGRIDVDMAEDLTALRLDVLARAKNRPAAG